MAKHRDRRGSRAQPKASPRSVLRRLQEAEALAPLTSDKPTLAGAPLVDLWPERRALLIINSKSGPGRDSLLRVREIVDTLAAFGIRADVRVKLRKSQARKQAKAAGRKGRYDLVIAAGGDGTVESVASGLMHSSTPLGIIPLGTYNNIASSLHIPSDVRHACALLGVGVPVSIDAGLVDARYMKRPRMFFEISTVGFGAAVGTLGQHLEKARWSDAARTLPAVIEMSPTPMWIRVDGQQCADLVNSLLVTVSNTPRAAAGLDLAPDALLDDGRLDANVYADMSQSDVVVATLPEPIGSHDEPSSGIRRLRIRSLEIDAARPMPVSIESKIVGVTPVRYTVVPGALRVIAGDTPALLCPAPADVMTASLLATQAGALQTADGAREPAVSTPSGPVTSAAQTLVPLVGGALEVGSSARRIVLPLASAAAGVLLGAFLRRRH
jgi:diacylglycerol kinase (ATP)